MVNTARVIENDQLLVHDLTAMTAFYRDRIGLAVLTTGPHQAILGVGDDPLLVLTETNQPRDRHQAGLYHTAFLLPSGPALGGILLHLLAAKTPLIGGADHGYSEAIYLLDPEGNGIELYHDQPESQWDRRPGGQIVGVTEELDASHLIAGVTATPQLPAGTKIGHLHLQVSDLAASRHFYEDLLGFDVKATLGKKAVFLAIGDYHHHLAINTWAGQLIPRLSTAPGLRQATFNLPNLAGVAARLTTAGWPHTANGQQIEVTDPNGVRLILRGGAPD